MLFVTFSGFTIAPSSRTLEKRLFLKVTLDFSFLVTSSPHATNFTTPCHHMQNTYKLCVSSVSLKSVFETRIIAANPLLVFLSPILIYLICLWNSYQSNVSIIIKCIDWLLYARHLTSFRSFNSHSNIIILFC